jgi:hypothetical protein
VTACSSPRVASILSSETSAVGGDDRQVARIELDRLVPIRPRAYSG